MKFISCFAGMGGFDLGLERSGMECVHQIEISRPCNRVLNHHWPKVPRTEDVTKAKIPEGSARLLCGGFPCQDLSVAGRGAGLAGKRSGLFFEFARIAAEVRPRYVLVENVPGLLSNNDGRDMSTVVRVLGKLGYGWAYRVLDAQYFGVPQQRRRVFIVGSLGGTSDCVKILFESESLSRDTPTSRTKGVEVTATLTSGSAVGRGVNRPGRRREDDVNLVARCDTTGHGKRYDITSDDFIVVEGMGGHHFVDTAQCIRPEIGVRHTDDFIVVEGASSFSVRRLTPLECLRLQGFPDDWLDLTPPLSDSAKYHMIGNAVAVPVIEWIGRRIMTLDRE